MKALRTVATDMLLKFLFLIIVLYFVAKTVRGLVQAISRDGAPSRLREEQEAPAFWHRHEARESDEHQDVEDAKFVDI